MINKGRFTATQTEPFVVFLLGSRVHKLWKVRQWLPIARAMAAMQRELASHPETGFLGATAFGMLNGVSVQYWRSFEDLERFARSREWSHLAAWRHYNKVIRDSGELGVWHETYRVEPGGFESVYVNMPVVGLAAASGSAPVGATSTAANRIGARSADLAPVEGY